MKYVWILAALGLSACGLYDTPQAIYLDEEATKPDGRPASCGDPCGVCGLGHYTCEVVPGFSAKQSRCVEPELEGLDPDRCGKQLFKVLGGLSSQDLADKPELKAILVQDGAVLNGLTLPSGVSLIGGFRSDWTYNPSGQSIIRSRARLMNGDSYGLQIGASRSRVQVAHLRIEVRPEDEGPKGSSSYGIYVRDVSDLELLDVQVLAASGQDGASGASGASGEQGGAGASYVGPLNCISNNYTPAASGTNPSCPVGTQGGLGGRGGLVIDQSMNSSGAKGLPEGLGGAAGNAQFALASAGISPRPFQSPAQAGQPGLSGGTINARGFWQPIPVDELANGKSGSPGVGGGGGGGSSANPQGQGLYCQGTPGASGGAGGCGGQGGQSGQPGGSSFGLFAFNSELRLERCIIEGAGPGRGGQGGRGGLGGLGGLGGASNVPTATGLSIVYPSAAGGQGRQGQQGGEGADGPDGISLGAYCQNALIFFRERSTSVFFHQAPTPSQQERLSPEFLSINATNCL